MKAFVLGVVAMVVISVGAAVGLGFVDLSAKSVYQTQRNVRL